MKRADFKATRWATPDVIRNAVGEQRVNHHTGVSCFAEYAVVSRRSCVKFLCSGSAASG